MPQAECVHSFGSTFANRIRNPIPAPMEHKAISRALFDGIALKGITQFILWSRLLAKAWPLQRTQLLMRKAFHLYYQCSERKKPVASYLACWTGIRRLESVIQILNLAFRDQNKCGLSDFESLQCTIEMTHNGKKCNTATYSKRQPTAV